MQNETVSQVKLLVLHRHQILLIKALDRQNMNYSFLYYNLLEKRQFQNKRVTHKLKTTLWFTFPLHGTSFFYFCQLSTLPLLDSGMFK